MKNQRTSEKGLLKPRSTMLDREIFTSTKLNEAFTVKYCAKYVLNYAVEILEKLNICKKIRFLVKLEAAGV